MQDESQSTGPWPVTVTDIDMPFWSMVGFMIKWAIASIPAALILFGVVAAVGFFAVVLFGAAVGLAR